MNIDTTIYYYAAYAFFWLLPTLFVIKTFSNVKHLERKLGEVETRLTNQSVM